MDSEGRRICGWCEMTIDRLRFGGLNATESAKSMLAAALRGDELPKQRARRRGNEWMLERAAMAIDAFLRGVAMGTGIMLAVYGFLDWLR